MEIPFFEIKNQIVYRTLLGRVEKFYPVRGGVSWPINAFPGYYIILGERYREDVDYQDRKRARGHLEVFAEYEHTEFSLNEFYRKLSDAANVCKCSELYTGPQEECQGHIDDFGRYLDKESAGLEAPAPAHDSENFSLGVDYIKRWKDTLNLPFLENSQFCTQLRALTRESYSEPKEKFHAINGLRYVIAEFERDPGYLYREIIFETPPLIKGPNSWMGC